MSSIFDFGTDEITAESNGGVAILRLGLRTLDYVPNLQARESYLEFFDMIDDDPALNTLLVLNQPGSYGETAYAQYLSSIVGTEVDLNNLESVRKFRRSTTRSRQIHLHQYSVKRKLESNTILIHGLQGNVVTPFIGECLSSDFRFASEDMNFSFAHVNYGLPPGGSLSYFLPKFIGQGKAIELMLQGGKLSSSEAAELGLINRVLPSDDFETHCIAAAREISELSKAPHKATKILNIVDKKELEAYLDAESAIYL